MKSNPSPFDPAMLFLEILIFSNLPVFGIFVRAVSLGGEQVAAGDEEAQQAAKEAPDYYYDKFHEQLQQQQQQRQHEQRSRKNSSDVDNKYCLKQVITRLQGLRILNATGMNRHVTPRDVDPQCVALLSTTPMVLESTAPPSRNSIDIRGMTIAEEGVIVFRLNKTGHDLRKVVIAKAELRIFMTARNETKEEPKKQKRNRKHQHKERYSISIYGLANDSFFLLASMNVRISNSKWQKFLLSTSYVQNLLHLAVDELVLKINCENCEQRVELYRGPHAPKVAEPKRKNKNAKNHRKKESRRQAKRAPKLMLEIMETI